jgi:archaeosine synthase beta-subunit
MAPRSSRRQETPSSAAEDQSLVTSTATPAKKKSGNFMRTPKKVEIRREQGSLRFDRSALAAAIYPDNSRERDAWILARRPPRHPVDPWQPRGVFLEKERSDSGALVQVAIVLLTNRACPWRCLMCDLWKTTTTRRVPAGAIPAQIQVALEQLKLGPGTRQIKLYNGGSFFDAGAIPPPEYAAIAAQVRGFDRVIVECHPALVGERCLEFRDLLAAAVGSSVAGEPQLEVAMGLETAHPEVLEKLNKRMTLDQFRGASEFLRRNDVALRVFVLVRPPFLDEAEALDWAERSVDFAFDCGATVVSLIPTRFGNGALEALAGTGQFAPPTLSTLEHVLAYGIRRGRSRVFADLWDFDRLASCPACRDRRRARLRHMNLHQELCPRVVCALCGGA